MQEGNLVVLDDFTLDAIKTKEFVKVMNVLDIENGLIITPNINENVNKSARNVNGFKVLSTEGLNVYDIFCTKSLCFCNLRSKALRKG